MKSNQKFVRDEDGVSPVIGVILMVAITVVLGAVVFILASDIGADPNQAPAMSFNKDESNDRLQVVSAGETAWSDIAATYSGDSGCTSDIASQTGDVTAGQALTVSSSSAAASGPYDCTIALSHSASNTLLGSWDFTVPGT